MASTRKAWFGVLNCAFEHLCLRSTSIMLLCIIFLAIPNLYIFVFPLYSKKTDSYTKSLTGQRSRGNQIGKRNLSWLRVEVSARCRDDIISAPLTQTVGHKWMQNIHQITRISKKNSSFTSVQFDSPKSRHPLWMRRCLVVNVMMHNQYLNS